MESAGSVAIASDGRRAAGVAQAVRAPGMCPLPQKCHRRKVECGTWGAQESALEKISARLQGARVAGRPDSGHVASEPVASLNASEEGSSYQVFAGLGIDLFAAASVMRVCGRKKELQGQRCPCPFSP